MSKKSNSVAMSLLCVLICISIALSGLTLYSQAKTSRIISYNYGDVEDVNQEDDVTIAGQYIIKSTLNISDAYKSGDTSNLSDFDKETLDMAKEVIDKVIEKDMTPYEKEKAIYQWLVSDLTSTSGILTVIPNLDAENDNPHDVLKNKSAVCVGYATTFRMFMQMLDIECKVIHNQSLYHSWNLVKLDDDWYHVDCYSDNGSAAFANFNMNDTQCSYSHDWTKEFFPKATGTKYNYLYSVCEEINSYYDIPEWVFTCIKDRKTVFCCTFKKKINEKNQYAANLMTENLGNNICASVNDYSVNFQWTLNDKGEYLLCYYVQYYDSNVTVDEKTEQKINDTIQEAMEKYVYEYPYY